MASKPNVVKIFSSFAAGTTVYIASVEVSISPGIPSYSVIGQCDSSIKESQGRLKSAFKSCGFTMPKGHITVGISPAYMKKAGTSFDLPIALGILFASGQLYLPADKKIYAEGELTLSGELKGTPGSCIRLGALKGLDYSYKIIPQSESKSAGLAGFTGQAVSYLSDLNVIFDGNQYKEDTFEFCDIKTDTDLLDISMLKGQEKTKRALLICAAGFHNILLMGSPGCGKTMAGKILAGILPKLSKDEIANVYAVSELVQGEDARINDTRPVRIIGPEITSGKLIGDSISMMPGELALANHGILFADELPLYKTEIIDLLKQPLESQCLRMTKRGITYSYDCKFIFLGTGNPCRCGMLYENGSKCRCTETSIKKYQSKITGPFMDRIDLFSEMRSISGNDMAEIYIGDSLGESIDYRKRVEDCWQIQHERNGYFCFNGHFDDEAIRELWSIPEKVIRFASEISEKGFFSARGFTRLIRVARTIADLSGRTDITEDDVSEASQFRYLGR